MLVKKVFLLCAAVCAAVFMCSCGAETELPENTVYTTFYAMYDLTSEIAGDKMNVVQLVPSGSGPHDFEPTAADIAAVSESKALVYCGSIDTYIGGIRETVEKSGVRTLDTANGVDIAKDAKDPHIWLDPSIALEQYTAISDMLSEIDPDNSAYYSERLATAAENINELQREIDTLKSTAHKNDIIVSHAAYGYLCNCIGIEQHAIEGGSGDGSDPTAKQMAELIEFAGENDIRIIFAQRNESDRAARAMAEEIGGDVLLLDPLEADTGSGGYFEVMQQNIQALGTALE